VPGAPGRDTVDDWVIVELDTRGGDIVTVPHEFYMRTMEYVYHIRSTFARAVPRQAAFLSDLGDRYTLRRFCRELCDMLLDMEHHTPGRTSRFGALCNARARLIKWEHNDPRTVVDLSKLDNH
jgi:hypothetical protein